MIIACNKCSTNFNLDDSLVKEGGSKVRCSVCKHIFTALPLPRELDQEPEESLDLEADDDFSFEETELEIDDDDESQDLELEESHWELEGDGIEVEDSGEEDFDSIESIEDTVIEDAAIEDAAIEDEPAFLDSTESEPTLKMEDDTASQAQDYQISDEISDENFEDDSLTGEDDFFEEEIIKERGAIEKPEPLMDITPRTIQRKKKPLVGTPVLVILLICFLVIGAYIGSVMTGYKIPYLSDIKIPFIEQYFKKPVPEKLDVKPIPDQKSVNGRFITNSTAGTLFVITGRVENLSDIVYSHIEIRGALITEGKVEAKTKNVFCGNIITEEMLETGNISDINKLLILKKGIHNSNVNIKPGAGVPFMVVFSDLPEKLQNFTVKVIKFEKTKKP